ncbi:laccase [Sarracenia purpurea var. burkii]
MEFRKSLKFELLWLFLLNAFVFTVQQSNITTLNWVLNETSFTRLCSTKTMLTMNGMFPGPALHARKGDRLRVNVQNQGTYNVTIHWHGVKQPRNPWSDGPEYVTQCPIKPGANFTYDIILSSEEGTMWWHAHSDWSRATVHGPLIVRPKLGSTYPFPQPAAEFPIVLASWYKGDVMEIIETALENGGEPNKSDAFTINGQPGDLYNCSTNSTYRMLVEYGKTYLLRVINSIMNEEMFFMVANHNLTVVGVDAAYVKHITTDYIMISPGQTMDVLITANQTPSHYYMAARAYEGTYYDNTTTTAIVQYTGNYTPPATPSFPNLPDYNDSAAVTTFVGKIRALANAMYPVNVPKNIDNHLYITIAVNSLPCTGNATCVGPDGAKLAASLNNVSFVNPDVDVLQAYYRQIGGVYTTDFPFLPPYFYNFTAETEDMPDNVLTPTTGTKVIELKYNSSVEIVFQGTNVLSGAENHPMHLHGYSFYFVGSGFGIFDNTTDPSTYNLVDPPEINTVGVPKNGWAAIRFVADNPGVWFMHCHLERHSSWGMDTVIIVKNGTTAETSMLEPPTALNPC